jgi:hypothetical protein
MLTAGPPLRHSERNGMNKISRLPTRGEEYCHVRVVNVGKNSCGSDKLVISASEIFGSRMEPGGDLKFLLKWNSMRKGIEVPGRATRGAVGGTGLSKFHCTMMMMAERLPLGRTTISW